MRLQGNDKASPKGVELGGCSPVELSGSNAAPNAISRASSDSSPVSAVEVRKLLAESHAHALVCPKPPLGYRMVKRAFDVVGAVAGLVVLSPMMLVTTVAVKATSPGPAIIRQRRFGRDCKPFTCYKFRTMKQDTSPDIPTSQMCENPQVMTPVGPFLRSSSIDELPQLVNILKGDMSAVGPRPMILTEYEQVIARDPQGANDIRPGLTGWAQINGRDAVGIQRKAQLDGEYRRNMSVVFDLRVMARTLGVVFTRAGHAAIEGDKANSAGNTSDSGGR